MTTEEIKLIIEAVSTTSGDAKTVLLAWLAVDLLKILIANGALLIGGWLLLKMLLAFFGVNNENESRLRELRDVLFPREKGTTVSVSEFRAIAEALVKKNQ